MNTISQESDPFQNERCVESEEPIPQSQRNEPKPMQIDVISGLPLSARDQRKTQ